MINVGPSRADNLPEVEKIDIPTGLIITEVTQAILFVFYEEKLLRAKGLSFTGAINTRYRAHKCTEVDKIMFQRDPSGIVQYQCNASNECTSTNDMMKWYAAFMRQGPSLSRAVWNSPRGHGAVQRRNAGA